MKLATAVLLTVFMGGSFALPTSDPTLARREDNTFFPIFWPFVNTPAPAPANGPTITAPGANLNGGSFIGGNGGNGGTISIGRRDKDTIFPFFWPSFNTPAPVNGPTINAGGASLNGGNYIYGDGGNGGKISIGRRDEDAVSSGRRTSNSRREDDFFFPIFWPSSNTPAPANGPAINAAGASLNGGNYINGNGGNGGTISIN